MLSVFRGHSVRYLTDEVATAREGYYTGAVAAGEPPGLWWGKGADTLGLAGEVDADLMKAVYTHMLDPRHLASHSPATWGEAPTLGSGHRKYRTAEQIYEGLLAQNPTAGPDERAQLRAQAAGSARQAVSFIDVTFSVPKSVTVTGLAFERAASEARAAGDEAAAVEWESRARAVEDAVMAGARAALEYLQDEAGYSRVGHHGGGGGRWIDAHEFVVAQFLQHDSRERDPQWHVHNAILNRVLCADGVWRGLDGMAIDQHKAAAGAYAERIMEARLAATVGVRCETRPDGKAREVVGIDPALLDLFSGRRRQIGPKAEELIRGFTDVTGRKPSSYERTVIFEQATLATRRAKSHDGETREEQFARWAEMARERVAGGLVPLAEQLRDGAQDASAPATFSPLDVIERAVASVGESRQHYNRSDMLFAICNALPGNLGVAEHDVRALLDGLTDAALERVQRLGPPVDDAELPAEVRLQNGESAYRRHGSARFSTPGQLAAERSLIAAAVERGAAVLPASVVDAAVARFAESGRPLGADQEAALRGVLTSGAQIEVLTAAAGTGKSFVVGAIADAWTDRHDPDVDPGRVFGLAPYQNAAEVLAGEGLATKNVAAWLATQGRLDRARPGTTSEDEAWRLRRGDLVVLDEAGTAETPAVVEVRRRCAEAGAKLLLVGDTRQLTTIGQGGALADVERHGITYRLAEVRRFRNEWEGPASLRLRDGDPDVLAEYRKRGRIVDGGTAEQAGDAAARAWLGRTLAGREALLMVDTNASAARVSALLRAELVRLGRVTEHGVPLGLGDKLADWRGTTAGVGDLVQARALAWHLRGFAGNTAAPITRQTYRVLALREDGGLTVAPIAARRSEADEAGGWNVWGERLGAPMQLPGGYVRDSVSLAYASTKDAAQGRTVDDGLAVVGAGTDANGLYVQATRGKESNTLFVTTRHLAADAETGETFEADERVAAAVVADALVRAREERSAVAEDAHASEEERSVMTNVDRMVDYIATITAGRTAAALDRLAASGDLTETHRRRLAADDAFGSLERLLRTAELAGHDPDRVLSEAVTARSLDDAEAPAQVLHHRISTRLSGRLTPNVHSGMADLIPADLGPGEQGEQRRAWLTSRAEAADTRRHELGVETAHTPPAWAVDALGPVPDAEDVIARQEWEHRAGWAASYRELVGYTDEHDPLGHAPGRGRVEHRMLFRAAHDALDLPHAGEEEAGMTDGRLRARVAAWERERNWAPAWVDEQLAATHQARDALAADASVWEARAAAPDTSVTDAARLRAEAAAAREQADQLAERLAQLEIVDDARAEWAVKSAVTKDNAERSDFELRTRGIDRAAGEPRVTGDQWLDVHRAEQREADRTREVREEYEVSDHNVDDAAAPEEPTRPDGPARLDERSVVVEPPRDIRETAVRDPGEDGDRRPRVPVVDETTAAVDRAHEARAELAARHSAEQEHAADEAAERQAAEDARRVQLTAWSADDVVEDQGASDDAENELIRD